MVHRYTNYKTQIKLKPVEASLEASQKMTYLRLQNLTIDELPSFKETSLASH